MESRGTRILLTTGSSTNYSIHAHQNPHIHITQMKLFTSIAAAAAVIGASFIAAHPAEARNGWVFITNQDGATNYMRYVGRSGNIVTIQNKWSDSAQVTTWRYNCNSWMKQQAGGSWKPIYPGSVAETKALKVC